MPNEKKTQKKLNAQHKAILIGMIAAYYENREIIQYFRDEYGISLAGSSVHHYRTHSKWAEAIWEARKDFRKTVGILPVSQKAYRIRVRQQLIYDLLKEDHLWCTEITKYGVKYRGNHHNINKILDSIREELEPRSSIEINKMKSEGEEDKDWEITVREVQVDINGDPVNGDDGNAKN